MNRAVDVPRTQTEVTLRAWTREEYDRMIDAGLFGPEDRVELVAGEIVTMTPQKSLHAVTVGNGQRVLQSAFGPTHHVRSQLPLALDPDSEPEPDLAVVPGDWLDYLEGHPTLAVLVVEVSDTTLRFDRGRKASVYARAGILDYWIIDLQAKRLEVYREPVRDEAAPLGWAYAQRQTFGLHERVAPLALRGVEIAVRDLLPDRTTSRHPS